MIGSFSSGANVTLVAKNGTRKICLSLPLLLANDFIMLERSICLFRHLECQNLSIISDSIGIPNGGEKIEKSEE